MQKTKKRVICLLLSALVVLLTFAPAAAFAVESDVGKILVEAYALAENEKLTYDTTLIGNVISVNTPYSAQYNNITVTMEIPGYASMPIVCYRLKGAGIETLNIGDTITVTGRLHNYYGTIEFDTGCTLNNLVTGNNGVSTPPEDSVEIVDAAYALDPGASLPYTVSITGKITSIDTPYDSSYKNITVTIIVSGRADKPIKCFRLKGDGAENLKVGDTITVTGVIRNYQNSSGDCEIEFNSGCTFVLYVAPPTDPKQIVDAAFALEAGASLPYEAQLTGTVTKIVTEYSEAYSNITVNIEVEGTTGTKTIECFRMKGDGVADIQVGDSVTVKGTITRYTKEATEELAAVDKIEFEYPTLVSRTVPGTDSGSTDNTDEPTVTLPSDGNDSVVTMYVKVPAAWTTVNAYAWSDSANDILGAWPGTAMTEKDGDWYKIVIPAPATGIVINNGADQTGDLTVEAGKDVYITVSDDNSTASVMYANGTVQGGNNEPADENITGTESNFRVVGNADFMGNWDPASDAGRMLEVYPGVYKVNFENVQPGDYEMKVTQNGTWDNSWGDNGNNFCFTILEACTITVTFTLEGEAISIKGESISNKYAEHKCSEHSYEHTVISATCTKGSYEAMVCTICGYIDPDSVSEEITPPVSHSYVTTVVAPTCTKGGYTVHSCSLCGASYTGGTTPAIGHSFSEFVPDGNVTCTTDGTKTAICCLCGIESTAVDESSALGHSFTIYLDDQNALCRQDGTKTAKCDRCAATDTVTIPGTAFGHEYTDGICSRCGQKKPTRLLGDLTGDDKLNIGDVATLYALVCGSNLTVDEALLAYADITGDNRLNVGDVARLYAHIRGTIPLS